MRIKKIKKRDQKNIVENKKHESLLIAATNKKFETLVCFL